MSIALGADQAGFCLKQELRDKLAAIGDGVMDLGSHSPESSDHPDFARMVAPAVIRLTRAHHDANVLTLGARYLNATIALDGARHARRLAKTIGLEQERV
jgi:ribose 5-phosphate isomerase RpiB